jgi:hypothetical protein
VLEFIRGYVVESDHTPVVCVIGHWVAGIFSMPCYTYHRCMCMCIVTGKGVVTVVKAFHVINWLTTVCCSNV